MTAESLDIIAGMSGRELLDLAQRGVELPDAAIERLNAWLIERSTESAAWASVNERAASPRTRHAGGRPRSDLPDPLTAWLRGHVEAAAAESNQRITRRAA